jgi:hypothetical protein
MPAKSRGGRKGKYAYQARKQGTHGSAVPVTEPAVSSPPRVSPRPASPPPAGKAAARISAGRSRNVGTELRNIGILVGVMIVILVVLARVLA